MELGETLTNEEFAEGILITRYIVYDGAVEITTWTSNGNPIDTIVYSGIDTVGDGYKLAGRTDRVNGRIYLKNYAGNVNDVSVDAAELEVSEFDFGKV